MGFTPISGTLDRNVVTVILELLPLGYTAHCAGSIVDPANKPQRFLAAVRILEGHMITTTSPDFMATLGRHCRSDISSTDTKMTRQG